MKLTEEQQEGLWQLASAFADSKYKAFDKLVEFVENAAEDYGKKRRLVRGTKVKIFGTERTGEVERYVSIPEITVKLDEPFVDGQTSGGHPNYIYKMQVMATDLEVLG